MDHKELDLSTITEKVLLVDDDEDMLGLLSRNVALFGLQADQARNGKEALQHLQMRSYGLIITDITMPVMDGIETLSAITAFNQRNVLEMSSRFRYLFKLQICRRDINN